MAHPGKWEFLVPGEREGTRKSAESRAGTPWGWGGIIVRGPQPKGGNGAVLGVREGGKQEALVGVPVNLSPFLWAAMAHTMMDLFSPPSFPRFFSSSSPLRVKVTLPPAHVLFTG